MTALALSARNASSRGSHSNSQGSSASSDGSIHNRSRRPEACPPATRPWLSRHTRSTSPANSSSNNFCSEVFGRQAPGSMLRTTVSSC